MKRILFAQLILLFPICLCGSALSKVASIYTSDSLVLRLDDTHYRLKVRVEVAIPNSNSEDRFSDFRVGVNINASSFNENKNYHQWGEVVDLVYRFKQDDEDGFSYLIDGKGQEGQYGVSIGCKILDDEGMLRLYLYLGPNKLASLSDSEWVDAINNTDGAAIQIGDQSFVFCELLNLTEVLISE